MHQNRLPVRGRAPRRAQSRAAGAALLGALLAGPALGQTSPPRFLVSTTSAVAGGGGVPDVAAGDLVVIQEGAPARVVFAAGHWLAAAGLDVGNVDALSRRPGEAAGSARALVFSTSTNVGGFLDGDVLGLSEGGGIEMVVPEEAFTLPLGLPAGSIDVDALAFDDQGRVLVSLRDNAPGTTLGDVLDGDVLRLEVGGGVSRVLTEAEVQQKFTSATGSTAAIGDVIGLDVVAGEFVVTIQSPSAYDGAVLYCGAAPGLLTSETGVGLGGAEIDGLLIAKDADMLPVVRMEPSSAFEGGTVHVEFEGEPGAALLVLYAGQAGYVATPGLGFGGFYLDPSDAWLNSIFVAKALPIAPLDPFGKHAVDYTLPFGVQGTGLDGKAGWSFQALDIGSLAVGAPFRLQAL